MQRCITRQPTHKDAADVSGVHDGAAGVMGLIGGGLAVLLTACGLVKSYEPSRYRLTVEVDTPQGLRTGSSVIEVTAGEVGTTLGGANSEARGEAVAVDLPGGQTLFALMKGDAETYNFPAQVMYLVTPFERGDKPKGFGPLLEAVRANRKVNVVKRMRPGVFQVDPPFSAYPMMVRFRDIADPKTVERVDPHNLAASFGDGVKLRRITVQMTEEPVTRSLSRRLPWLNNLKQFRTDPNNVFSSTLPNEIGGLRSGIDE